jgi:hypothetical protein
MWFSALKLGLNAATHIYKKKQETKMKMADAQHLHADRMARGEEAYQGKLLEARQSDWKDEFVLVVLTLPMMKGGRVKKMGGGMSKLNPGLQAFMKKKMKKKM